MSRVRHLLTRREAPVLLRAVDDCVEILGKQVALPNQICALDDALDALAAREPRRAKVIELRYFGGLSVDETAEALAVSPRRSCRLEARTAWLALELKASRQR